MGYEKTMFLPFVDRKRQEQDFSISSSETLTVLGLESSCDETACSVIRRLPDGTTEILSNIVASQIKEHAPYGGVVPEIAARAHMEHFEPVIKKAMGEAGLVFSDLDGIAATAGPGLIGGVLTGLMTGKALAFALNRPLIAVNHLEGHALSVLLHEKISFPYLLLLVSGGHTQTLRVDNIGSYRRLGASVDDAAGEAFDKIAKLLSLGFPGGPAVEKAAGQGDPTRFPLPRSFYGADHGDFSFSGLKTAVRRAYENLDSPTLQDRADLAASAQLAIAESLAERSSWAMKRFLENSTDLETKPCFVASGGVAANTVLRTLLKKAAEEYGFSFLVPPLEFCTDNAAMIALAGAERLALGESSPLDVSARARWPLDEKAAMHHPVLGSGRKGPRA